MVMTPWMTSFSTVSYLITGMKSIEPMAHLLNQDTDTQLLFVEVIFIFLVVWIPINRDSMMYTSLILTKESGLK